MSRRRRAGFVSSSSVTVWSADLAAWNPAGAREVAESRLATRRLVTEVAVRASLAERGWGRRAEIVRVCPVCGQTGHGRPTVSGAGHAVGISASASGGYAVVAVGEGHVGIDIEVEGQRGEPPARVLTEAEASALARVEAAQRWRAFLRIWTAKEAVAKADGRGLLAPLNELDASVLVGGPVASVVLGGRGWNVRVCCLPLHGGVIGVVAVATEGPQSVVWKDLAPSRRAGWSRHDSPRRDAAPQLGLSVARG